MHNNFWLGPLAFVLAAIAMFHFMLRRLIAHNEFTRREVLQLTGAAAAVLCAPALIVRVIATASGHTIAICDAQSYRSVPGVIALVLQVASWATLLWWVWRTNGASVIARAILRSSSLSWESQRASGNHTHVVIAVRAAILTLILAGLAGSSSRVLSVLLPICARARELPFSPFG
jgi:hypothetical protein